MTFLVLILLFSCLPGALIAAAATSTDEPVKRNLLNQIFTTGNGSFGWDAHPGFTQHIVCGSTEAKAFGIYPTSGSEVGGTPVVAAAQISHDADSVVDSLLRCKFGEETSRPVSEGSEEAAQILEMLASTTNSSTDVSFHEENYQLLVCVAPPFPMTSSGMVPGPVPFSIACDGAEEESIEDSTLSFHFTLAASVHSIHPPLGGPGSKVTVKGSGFYNSSSLTCFFGEHGAAVKAESNLFISSEMVVCTAPDRGDGEYPVAVSNNGIDFEGWTSATFAYVSLPIVESVHPETITWSEDATISISGLHFEPHRSAIPICSFGEDATSLAVVESDDLMSCDVPAFQDMAGQRPRIASVRVSTNGGIDWSTPSRVFVFAPALLHSAIPNVAQLVGSEVTVHGQDFHPSAAIACWFHLDGDVSHVSVPATYISSSKLVCPTSQARVGLAKLWVSTNNQVPGRSDNSLDFEFLDDTALTSVEPPTGSLVGGTSVVVRGTGFSPPSSCRFGTAAVAAQVLNSTYLTCISPPAATALGGSSFEEWGSTSDFFEVSLEISINGGHGFTESGSAFRYSDQHSIESMSPTNGPQTGRTNITFSIPMGDATALTNISLWCRFSTLGLELELPKSPVTNLGNNSLSCMTPSISSYITATADQSSAVTAGVKIVDLNGDDVIATGGAVFTFFPNVLLAKLYPPGGSELGGTDVEIYGSNFVSSGLKCIFGGIQSPLVRWISPSRIICKAPEAASRSMHASVANVTLGMIGGESSLTSDGLSFVYLPIAQITSFTPMFGSLRGGTSIHIQGSGFEQIEGVSPQCVFSNGTKSMVATVLSRNLVKCDLPAADFAENATSVALSFNGGVDVISANQAFTYVEPATISEISPTYLSTAGGGRVVVKGSGFMPESNVGGAWMCLFGDAAVAATAGDAHTMVCPTPSLQPGMVKVRASLNGADFTNAANVIYHLPTEIHKVNWDLVTDSGAASILLDGANFQPSHDLTCIFHFSPERVEMSEANYISESQINCTVPSAAWTTAISLEVSTSKESIPGNPRASLEMALASPIDLNASPSEGTEVVLLDAGDSGTVVTEDTVESAKLSVESVEPTVISETGGSIISVVISEEMRGRNASCTFSATTGMSNISSPASAVTKHVADEAGRRFYSSLLTCEAPKLQPGSHLLTLKSTPTSEMVISEAPVIIVHPSFSLVGFEPLSGPYSGGTHLSLYGSNIPNTTDLSCKVGSTVTRAKFVTGEMIMCTVPPAAHSALSVPTHPISAHVSVSANGQDFVEIKEPMFSYTKRPKISSIFPKSGTVKGGTGVTIIGENLVPSTANEKVVVLFDGVSVTGTPLNETSLNCVTPPLGSLIDSTSSVRISTNGGHDLSHSETTFSYYELAISRIIPWSGPARGGNTVIIVGSGFGSNEVAGIGNAVCRFGATSTPALSVSEESIECQAPEHIAHSVVEVTVRIDGVDASSSSTYSYLPMLQIDAITPNALPTSVPTVVHCSGENFLYPSELLCKLGTTVVSKAVVLNDNSLKCYIPPIHEPGAMSFDIVSEGGESMLEISSDIEFYDPAEFRITPPFGSNVGGTLISAPFDRAPTIDSKLFCRFLLKDSGTVVTLTGHHPVPSTIDVVAILQKDNLLSCTTPNVTSVWPADDDHMYAEVSVISPSDGEDHESSLPLSSSFMFLFKALPAIGSISPRVGQTNGGTTVRVTGRGPGSWLNSTLLTCYFGAEKAKAVWIGPLFVDCISPGPRNVSEVVVTVSDNKLDFAKSEATFSFRSVPYVTSLESHFGLASHRNAVTLIGTGFSRLDKPMCRFRPEHNNGAVEVMATFLNDTAMTCHVLLESGEYQVHASNNGGLEWSPSDAQFIAVNRPSIVSLSPPTGTEGESMVVGVFGDALTVGLQNTHCHLLDSSGALLGSSVAEAVNKTLVICPIECPIQNITSKYYLGISVDNADLSSKHEFWCDPKPSILDWMPRYISVGESTPLRINMGDFRSAHLVSCIFAGRTLRTTAARYVSGGVFECLSPEIDRPERLSLSISVNNLTIADELQLEAVDPVALTEVSPKIIFAGSDVEVEIKASNLVPERMSCHVGGREGLVVTSNESCLVCRSSAKLESNSTAAVSVSFKMAPQLNATAGIVEIHPAPIVHKKMRPSSGGTHGGTHVIVRGVNFRAIGSTVCYFGDISVPARVLTANSLSCKTPPSDVGEVEVQVSLDGGKTAQGADSFTFFTPVVLNQVYPRVAVNGTTLHLSGEGFYLDLPIWCSFGGKRYSRATVFSSTEATCMLTMDDFGSVDVSIVTSDRIPASVFIDADTRVLHHPLVEISSALPLYGSVIGGELIEVQVYGISSNVTVGSFGPIHCRFGEKLVALATRLSEISYACTVPAASKPGKTSLSLLYGGMPFSSNSLAFEYAVDPRVYGISPGLGPHSGGTAVKVHGLNLISRGEASCRFGAHESYGYLDMAADGASALICVSPSLNYDASLRVYIKLGPTKDWLDTSIDFHFVEPITIDALTPLEIDSSVEFIRVKGRGLSTGADLLCFFGERGQGATTKAIAVSNVTVKCPFPWDNVTSLGPQIPLSVSSNGIDFVRSTSLTHKAGGMVITSLSPSLVPAWGSMVDIYGSGFKERSSLTCWFGSVATPATILSDDHIQCFSNAVLIRESERVAQASLTVTEGRSLAPLSSRTLNITYYSHPKLDMHPAHGVSTGGTQVRFSSASLADVIRKLTDFDVQVEPMCQFGSVAVPATIENEKVISCISPSMELGTNSSKTTQVSMSLNQGVDFVFSHDFHFYPPVTIDAVLPNVVWVDVPQEIVIRGSDFLPLTEVCCLVGDLKIRANIVSSSELRCSIHLKQTYSDQFVPISVSLNGADVSNVISLFCRVQMPTVLVASPLFLSNSGGTVVELKGHGFDVVPRDSHVMLGGNVAKLNVIDDETASFVSPSCDDDSAVLLMDIGSDTLVDTGFELKVLPHLHISSVEPVFIFIGKVNRVSVHGEFDRRLTYSCILSEDAVEGSFDTSFKAKYIDGHLVCDVTTVHPRPLRINVRREEDNQTTSNDVNIFPTPQYFIDSVTPHILSEGESSIGGQQLHITSLTELAFTGHDQIQCRFIDDVGTSSLVGVELTTDHDIKCVAPSIVGNAEVSLARDGISQSNALALSVRPTSRIGKLFPESGPLDGGTRIKVHGVGFASYRDANVSCYFGHQTTSTDAEITDDETVQCTSPSSEIEGHTALTLVLTNVHGHPVSISTSAEYQYYMPPQLDLCTPDNGPASGGVEIKLLGKGFSGIGSPPSIRFMSVTEPSKVTYSTDVKLESEHELVVKTPNSPDGSEGGISIVTLSRNGQDYSTSGIYYNYAESTFIRSFKPGQVMESSCFNLTMVVENLISPPSQCVIGNANFTAKQGLISGTVVCDVCLDLREGRHQVGLLTENAVFTRASLELDVRSQLNITDIAPAMGPLSGGTVLTIKGEDFEVWREPLYCFFGEEVRALATVLNDNVAQCVAPASSVANKVNVHVAPLGQFLTREGNVQVSLASGSTFEYYEAESIDSFSPRSGPAEGGTVVRIRGSGFLDGNVTCKFGMIKVSAISISEHRVECEVPPLQDALVLSKAPPSSVPLMVSKNGVDYVSCGTYVYHYNPELKLTPSIGPALTKVTLFVKPSLGWVEKLMCSFGEVMVDAVMLSGDEIDCIAPIQDEEENSFVTVQISFNGVDFFGDVKYQYSRDPLIYSMTPSYGPMSGGNTLAVHGKSLDFASDEDNILCKFGSIETMATLISATKIACIVPPQSHGTVSFSVTSIEPSTVLDEYLDSAMMEYRYLPQVVIHRIHPMYGDVRGGTLLSIEVGEVPEVENLFCVFGDNEISISKVAYITNGTSIHCPTPPGDNSRAVSVGLAQDEIPTMLTSNGVGQFRYTDTPVIFSMVPRRGLTSGGNVVTITGNKLLPSDKASVLCKFGNKTSAASFVSNDEVKCRAPGYDAAREIQAIRVAANGVQGSFTLGFKNDVTDPIRVDSSADTMMARLLSLPGIEDVSVTVELEPDSTDPGRKTFLVTFLGLVQEDQPLMTAEDVAITGDDTSVSIDRIQSLCCNVSLTVNGADYFGASDGEPLIYVYDERLVVTSITPPHGTINGGSNVEVTVSGAVETNHRLKCMFGSAGVEGLWVDDETIACSTPASLWETSVAVGIKIGDVSAESDVFYFFHSEPVVASVFPKSLPALDMTTAAIDIYGDGFYNFSMVCLFESSVPSQDSAVQHQRSTYKQPAIFFNRSHIHCPSPPTLQDSFSEIDLNWRTNETLLEGSILEIFLEVGADRYAAGTIPYHAVVKASSISPRTGPRSGATEVVVDGGNFINSTELTCKFGSVVGPSAQFLSSSKVICVTPHFPSGYGRKVVPVQVAVNGVDFSLASTDVLFEFHEAIVIKEATPLLGLPKGGTSVTVTLDDVIMRHKGVSHQVESNLAAITHVEPRYGPEIGGNLVTIYGSGFSPNHYTVCRFGEIVAPAYLISEESIECIAPKSPAEPVDVTLIIDGIALAPLSHTYTYLPMLQI
ncbi:hypothetical protein ACHAWF_019001 [Thalassiosira exigua]